MPSQRRSSSRLRSSAAKKIQKRIRGKQTRKQVTKLKASRKIQSRVRGKQTRKVMKRVKSNMLTNNDCSICLEPLTENVATALPCGHRFHKDCIVNWLVRSQGKCPNCKQRITNIPYISIERQIQPLFQIQPQSQLLDLEPLQLIQHLIVRNQELDVIEQSIERLRELLPDAPEIPNITFNDSLSNQYSADQTEYYVRRLYNEASYNYNNYRSLNINDETLEQDVSNMFFITSELLTRARDNSRNAHRICSHIANIEFAEYM